MFYIYHNYGDNLFRLRYVDSHFVLLDIVKNWEVVTPLDPSETIEFAVLSSSTMRLSFVTKTSQEEVGLLVYLHNIEGGEVRTVELPYAAAVSTMERAVGEELILRARC